MTKERGKKEKRRKRRPYDWKKKIITCQKNHGKLTQSPQVHRIDLEPVSHRGGGDYLKRV